MKLGPTVQISLSRIGHELTVIVQVHNAIVVVIVITCIT